MEESKDHLNIDLEFLDKKEPVRVAPKPEPPKENEPNWRYYDPNNVNPNSGKQYNWKSILIIGGVILYFGWAIFSDNNSTSNTNSGNYTPLSVNQASSNSDTVVIGEYRCSRYNYDKAVALAPSESEQQIDTAGNALEYRSNEIDRLKNEIASSYVTEYSSQYEINQYNVAVNEYNSKLTLYKRDAASFSSRVDKYNAQVDVHNNYLRNNCTLNR